MYAVTGSVASAIDYISASYRISQIGSIQSALMMRLSRIVGQPLDDLAVAVRRWASYGYAGYRAQHGVIGVKVKADGEWYRYETVTGNAAMNWHVPTGYSIRDITVNRIDLAATALVTLQPLADDEAIAAVESQIRQISDWLQQWRADPARHYPAWRKRVVITEITSNRGSDGTTLYIGRRGSDRVCRIYNKAAQARLRNDADRLMPLLRIEVELRNDMARDTALTLYGNEGRVKADMVGAVMADMVGAYGIQLPATPLRIARIPDDEPWYVKRKRWLETVASGIRELATVMPLDDVIEIVFGADVAKIYRDAQQPHRDCNGQPDMV